MGGPPNLDLSSNPHRSVASLERPYVEKFPYAQKLSFPCEPKSNLLKAGLYRGLYKELLQGLLRGILGVWTIAHVRKPQVKGVPAAARTFGNERFNLLVRSREYGNRGHIGCIFPYCLLISPEP